MQRMVITSPFSIAKLPCQISFLDHFSCQPEASSQMLGSRPLLGVLRRRRTRDETLVQLSLDCKMGGFHEWGYPQMISTFNRIVSSKPPWLWKPPNLAFMLAREWTTQMTDGLLCGIIMATSSGAILQW